MQEIDRFVNYKVEVKFLHKKISCPHNILSLKAHTLSNVHYLILITHIRLWQHWTWQTILCKSAHHYRNIK